MHNFSDMNKAQLRNACKDAGIRNYGKMTTAQMREALETYHTAQAKAAKVSYTEEQLAAMQREGANGVCPHCGIDHLENGWSDFEAALDIAEGDLKLAMQSQEREYVCLACNGEWGNVINEEDWIKPAAQVKAPTTTSRSTGTGIVIEKNREERNGIKRPSAGGACDAVWRECDVYFATNNAAPKPKHMKEWATKMGLNQNNAVIELYNWRKWKGISK